VSVIECDCRAGDAGVREVGQDTEFLALTQISVGEIVRECDLDERHVERLVEVGGGWPPIVVWGPDNVIIDGLHRFVAARRLGHAAMAVVRFRGDAEAAYVESIARNTRHGLPLTVHERLRAARRLLERHPQWSDRRIAGLCGVAAKTVANARRHREVSAVPHPAGPAVAKEAPGVDRVSTGGLPPGTDEGPAGHGRSGDVRVGKDGKVRFARAGEARARVLAELARNPEGSLRQIARRAGVSAETVRTVRNSMGHPAPDVAGWSGPRGPRPLGRGDIETLLSLAGLHLVDDAEPWKPDDAFSSRPDSSVFARWFERTAVGPEAAELLRAVPLSRAYEVADEARARAARWSEFARLLERRTH
jgi:hypothetical protein